MRGKVSLPNVLSISSRAFLCTSCLTARYVITKPIVLFVVSTPAAKRSFTTLINCSSGSENVLSDYSRAASSKLETLIRALVRDVRSSKSLEEIARTTFSNNIFYTLHLSSLFLSSIYFYLPYCVHDFFRNVTVMHSLAFHETGDTKEAQIRISIAWHHILLLAYSIIVKASYRRNTIQSALIAWRSFPPGKHR